MECSFCNKVCKNGNSLRNHERLCTVNPNRQILKSNLIDYHKKVKLGIINKYATNQFTKARLLGTEYVVSEETRKKLSDANSGRKLTPETIEKLKISMRAAVKRNPDSYTASNISGRTPIIVYNGIKLKGTWEVETAKWLDTQNISWTNVITGFDYEWNNATHLYYPDFYLPEFDCYIEVKGYERDRDRAKWKSLDNLIILKQKEINKIKNNTLVFEDVWPLNSDG